MWMRTRILLCAASVLLAFSAQAADQFLADRHQAKGLNNSLLKREGFLGTSTDFSFRSF
jgi:hypothetical protein